MVHIKVIRGSRLLLCVAVLALAAVAVLLAIRFLPGNEPSVNTTASLVEATECDEAETEQVFASSSEYHGAPASMRLPLDPESPVIDIEIVPIATPTSVPSPRILIYHTHTHEAYAQTEDDPYEAAKGADAVLLMTDWKLYTTLDWKRIFDSMRKPALVFDTRNCLDRAALEKIGFKVLNVGR